jgi:hypothetical protein
MPEEGETTMAPRRGGIPVMNVAARPCTHELVAIAVCVPSVLPLTQLSSVLASNSVLVAGSSEDT